MDDPSVFHYFDCSKVSCYICWGVLQDTPFRTKDTHANLWRACAFPFSFTGAETNSRCQILLALKGVQDRLIEKVLRLKLDREFSLSDNLSFAAETEPGGELKHRRRTKVFWQPNRGGPPVQIVRTRAVRIPVDGEPVSEVVDIRVAHWTERSSYDVMKVSGCQYKMISPLDWTNSHWVDTTHQTEVYACERGNDRTTLTICAKEFDASNPEKNVSADQGLLQLFVRSYGYYV
jgi:hypothetical protein